MNKMYYVGDQVFNPVTDGVLETIEVYKGFDRAVLVLAFYDVNDELVAPTSGSVYAEMSPVTGQWHLPSTGDYPVVAPNVAPGIVTYEIPQFDAPATRGRIRLTGITGAVKVSAFFWGY